MTKSELAQKLRDLKTRLNGAVVAAEQGVVFLKDARDDVEEILDGFAEGERETAPPPKDLYDSLQEATDSVLKVIQNLRRGGMRVDIH